MNDPLYVGGIAVILTLFKVFDYFTKKRLDAELLKIIDRIDKKLNIIEDVTKQTWDAHEHYDQDGIPLWYVPRSWANTQKQIVNILQDISKTLIVVSHSQENITTILKELNK